jgi:hypothetical protein
LNITPEVRSIDCSTPSHVHSNPQLKYFPALC